MHRSISSRNLDACNTDAVSECVSHSVLLLAGTGYIEEYAAVAMKRSHRPEPGVLNPVLHSTWDLVGKKVAIARARSPTREARVLPRTICVIRVIRG